MMIKDAKPRKANFLMRLLGVDRILERLDTIDERMAKVEACVSDGSDNARGRACLKTGHWNDCNSGR